MFLGNTLLVFLGNAAKGRTVPHARLFNGPLSGTIWGQVPEETFTHTHSSWSQDILYKLPPSTKIHSILLFNLRAWQSFSTTSLQVFFDLSLGLEPSTLYSKRFFNTSKDCPTTDKNQSTNWQMQALDIWLSVASVCLFIHPIKGKRLEISEPKLIEI